MQDQGTVKAIYREKDGKDSLYSVEGTAPRTSGRTDLPFRVLEARRGVVDI